MVVMERPMAENGAAAHRAKPRASGERAFALVAPEMERMEALLAERMESPIGLIPQVGSHLLGAGGKRLRPLLAALAARASDTSIDIGLAVGCAAELIHTA